MCPACIESVALAGCRIDVVRRPDRSAVQAGTAPPWPAPATS